MLMTPITPKVMASPIAASSSTEPSESPYQAFCSAVHMARLFSIEAMASVAAFLTAGGALAGRPPSKPSASWSPRWRTIAMASSSLSASDAPSR